MNERLNRRTFLKSTGTAAAAGLVGTAGCLGDGEYEGPEALMLVGFPEDGAQVLRDYYDNFDIDIDLVVPDGLQDPELPGEVGEDLTDITGTVPAPAGPNADAFAELYEDAYDRSPGVFTSHTFDSVALLLLANAAAGENNGPAIQQQIRRVANPGGEEVGPGNLAEGVQLAAEGSEVTYSGASSECNFDENGNMAAAAYNIWEYTGDADDPIRVLDTIEFEAEHGGPAADESPGGTGREIMVGILLPESGDLAPVGGPMIDAGELAAELVAEADIDVDVDYRSADTQTDTDAALSAAGQLVDAGYPAICGAASSDNSIPFAEQVCAANQVVGCSPSATAPAITDLGDDNYFFRTAPSDALQGGVMAEVTYERLEDETASTLFRNDDYGQQLSQNYVESYEGDFGGDIFHTVSYDPDDSSFFSPLDEALSPP